MNLGYLLAVAFGLAMDAFAVSIGISLGENKLTRGQVLRLAFFFGFFQAGMPVLGWLAGKGFVSLLMDYDHWVAFGLLALIGGRMIRESFSREKKNIDMDRTRGFYLVILSVATSIDAFAAGMTFAAVHTGIWAAAGVIGSVAFVMTGVGASLGPVFGRAGGRRAELAGGLLLIGIGIKILVDHL